jgi:hypothetical protein
MSEDLKEPVHAEAAAVQNRRAGLSLDVWAVLAALSLALMVRLGVLQHIPW